MDVHPHKSEVAAAISLTLLQVRECLERSQSTISLSLKVGNEHDTELAELLENNKKTPEEFIMQSGLSDSIEQLLAKLTPQQQEVLKMRFGLDDGQPKTLAAIGDAEGGSLCDHRLNLSRERVRQVERKALQQLRQRQGIAEKLANYWQ